MSFFSTFFVQSVVVLKRSPWKGSRRRILKLQMFHPAACNVPPRRDFPVPAFLTEESASNRAFSKAELASQKQKNAHIFLPCVILVAQRLEASWADLRAYEPEKKLLSQG